MHEIHAVLLAAGGSSRLGRGKQLVEFRGTSLVRRAASQLALLIPEVTVVTGAHADRVARELQGLNVTLCFNPRWREGIGSSIALAIQGLAPGTPAVMIMLCDQYLLTADDLERLLGAWRAHPERITAARWADSMGPPVIFPGTFLSGLARLSGDQGARRLLLEQRAQINFVDMPNAAHDVDDAQDLAQLEALNGPKG